MRETKNPVHIECAGFFMRFKGPKGTMLFQNKPRGYRVRRSSERDKHMPDGVVERVFFVMLEEICADGIEDSLRHDPPESRVRHVLPHWP